MSSFEAPTKSLCEIIYMLWFFSSFQAAVALIFPVFPVSQYATALAFVDYNELCDYLFADGSNV